jgi:acetyl/propionyl-CoA carboxylase alpha subunit
MDGTRRIRIVGQAMKFKRPGESQQFEVEIVAREGATVSARIDGVEVIAEVEPLADGSSTIRIGDRRTRIFGARIRNSILVAAGPASFEFVPVEGRTGAARHGLAAPEVTAPMPGKVLKILVAEGDSVDHGQALAVLEAMKMETTLYAESAATVKKILVNAGQMVDHGAVLIEFSPAPTPADPSKNESTAPAA